MTAVLAGFCLFVTALLVTPAHRSLLGQRPWVRRCRRHYQPVVCFCPIFFVDFFHLLWHSWVKFVPSLWHVHAEGHLSCKNLVVSGFCRTWVRLCWKVETTLRHWFHCCTDNKHFVIQVQLHSTLCAQTNSYDTFKMYDTDNFTQTEVCASQVVSLAWTPLH